jgi:catechol 2,3-dioxygenase-like lactoylglutathione lyase family enzyme
VAEFRESPVLGLSHAGIQVSDADRSIAFYELLGLELASRWTNDRPYVQRLVGYPGVALDCAFMSIPGSSSFLEILQYHGTHGVPIDPATANTGTGHLCLYVRDLETLYAKLLRAGVEFICPPQIPDVGANKGGRVLYLKDPDGIRVELTERPRTKS